MTYTTTPALLKYFSTPAQNTNTPKQSIITKSPPVILHHYHHHLYILNTQDTPIISSHNH